MTYPAKHLKLCELVVKLIKYITKFGAVFRLAGETPFLIYFYYVLRSVDFYCSPNRQVEYKQTAGLLRPICLSLFYETHNKLKNTSDIGTYLHRTCTLFNSYYHIFRIVTEYFELLLVRPNWNVLTVSRSVGLETVDESIACSQVCSSTPFISQVNSRHFIFRVTAGSKKNKF